MTEFTVLATRSNSVLHAWTALSPPSTVKWDLAEVWVASECCLEQQLFSCTFSFQSCFCSAESASTNVSSRFTETLQPRNPDHTTVSRTRTSAPVLRNAALHSVTVTSCSNTAMSGKDCGYGKTNILQTVVVPTGWILLPLVDPLTLLLAPPRTRFCPPQDDPLTFHLAPSAGQSISVSNTFVYDQIPAN